MGGLWVWFCLCVGVHVSLFASVCVCMHANKYLCGFVFLAEVINRMPV